MTIAEFLKAQGLTDEEAAAVMGSPKQVAAFNAALQTYDEGMTAKQQAEAAKKETDEYWASKMNDLQTGANRIAKAEKQAAEAEAEKARAFTYMKELKAKGYDVPDFYAEVAAAAADPARNPETGKYITREDFAKEASTIPANLMAIQTLSNQYFYLTGEPYLNGDTDLEEARKSGKSVREYVSAKYDFAGKQAKKDSEKSEAAYQKRYNEDLAKEKAKWAETHGSNPDTRAPMPSKFDRLVSQEGFKEDSWKTPEGRRANKVARLKKFENAPLMLQ